MPDLYNAPRRQPVKTKEIRKKKPKTVMAPKKKIKKKSKFATKHHRYQRLVKDLSTKAGLTVNPQSVEFANQKTNESVLFLLRRHLITNFPWVAVFALMIGAIFFAFHFNIISYFPSPLQVVVVYAWLLLALIVFWSGFLSWYFNVNIVSNERVVDIDFYNLIYREVTDAEIEKIQDVTHKMGGILGIVFNYGDVYIQTAGTKPEIEFLKVPRPAAVADVLRKIREEIENGS